jgi:hypothetical protein
MVLRKPRTTALAALLLLFLPGGLTHRTNADEAARELPPRSAKPLLTPASFPGLHALIRPHDNEWRHLRVDWLTDVVAARRKAAAEDKPLIICYTGGAGYNEPLGTC